MGPLAHSRAALAALLAAPVALLGLALRPGWRPGLGERLGRLPAAAPGALWVHGASVGEIQAAARLLAELERRGHPVRASTTTLTGRSLLRGGHPEWPCTLAPLDHPWCVESALARVRPAALVLVETELWPGWIAGATRHGVPVVLVSGRLSERSFPRYRRFRAWLRPTLRRLAAVGARGAADAERFAALGVPPERISITGDLKLEPPGEPPRLAPELAAALGDGPLLVAGSTHAGEEEAALGALAAAEAAGLAPLLALAPRRPERFDAVARAVESRGRRLRRRSALGAAPLAAGEVLLLDSLGELAGLYTRARVAFVGGSLVPRGGHNVLEPVFAGVPVLFGPSTESAREAAEILLASGGGRRVRDTDELAREVVAALRDPAEARARGARGLRALEAHRGAASRSARLVEEVLERSGPGKALSAAVPA